MQVILILAGLAGMALAFAFQFLTGPNTQGWSNLFIFIVGAVLFASGAGTAEIEDDHKDKGRPYQPEPDRPIDWTGSVDRALREYKNGGIESAAYTLEMFVKHNRPNEARQFAEAIGLDAVNAAARAHLRRKRKDAIWDINSMQDFNDWLRWKRGEIL